MIYDIVHKNGIYFFHERYIMRNMFLTHGWFKKDIEKISSRKISSLFEYWDHEENPNDNVELHETKYMILNGHIDFHFINIGTKNRWNMV